MGSEDTTGCGCGCGTPSREQLLPDLAAPGTRSTAPAGTGRHTIEQIQVPAGTFTMGDSSGDKNLADGETPLHQVAISAFEIDATTVTNDDFARFVEASGYVTEAESFGFSAVFHLALAAPEEDIMGPADRKSVV